METEVWILGGAGRSGRVIAAELMRRGLSPVLVGRNGARLSAAASQAVQGPQQSQTPQQPQPRTLVAASIDDMAAAIRRDQPAVVINTVGPFATTAGPIARACLPHSHYVDLANDVAAVTTVLTPITANAGAWLYDRERHHRDILNTHADRGSLMIYFAIALLAVAAMLALIHRREVRASDTGRIMNVAIAVIAIVVGVATIVQVVRIGDSGARSVWANELTKSDKP